MTKRKKKILLYNNYFTMGGVEMFLRTVATHFADEGYDITVAGTPRIESDYHKPYGPKVKYVWRPMLKEKYKKHSPAWFVQHVFYRILRGTIEQYLSLHGYDIVVAVKEKWVMRDTLRVRGKRKLAWIHRDYGTFSELHEDCFATPEEERQCMRRFEKVVCVSEVTRKGVIDVVGDPGNLIVRYLPIDDIRVLELSALPCPLTRPADRPLLVTVGRLAAEKQYIMLLKACEKLRRQMPFELWLIGEGDQRPALEKYIKEHALDCVKLVGEQSNPYNYLVQADLFISSSRTESYGIAVQESLIVGVPVVAVRCPGIEESLDPRFGVLIENSAEALADAIGGLLQNPQELQRYRDVIAAEYDRDGLFLQHMAEIRELWENEGAV